MATNQPTETAIATTRFDRSHLETEVMGEDTFVKRDKTRGQFTARKEDGEKSKGVRTVK